MASGPLQPMPKLIELSLAVRPRRILDLGMGTGKYGFLLREQTDLAYSRAPEEWQLHLTGVEGHAEHIGPHQRSVYDEIEIAEISEFVEGYDDERFDLTLLIDVIEHFAPADAKALVDRVLVLSRYLLISTPTAYYAQENTGCTAAGGRRRSCEVLATPAPSASSVIATLRCSPPTASHCRT